MFAVANVIEERTIRLHEVLPTCRARAAMACLIRRRMGLPSGHHLSVLSTALSSLRNRPSCPNMCFLSLSPGHHHAAKRMTLWWENSDLGGQTDKRESHWNSSRKGIITKSVSCYQVGRVSDHGRNLIQDCIDQDYRDKCRKAADGPRPPLSVAPCSSRFLHSPWKADTSSQAQIRLRSELTATIRSPHQLSLFPISARGSHLQSPADQP